MPLVTLRTGRSFVADPATSILDAARAHGVSIEYSCRTGRCGACKASVASGATTLLRPEDEGLSAADVAAGFILTCCRAAANDVSLDIEPLDRLLGLDVRTMPARIVSLDHVAPDIVSLALKTPPTAPLRFVAGQYIDVLAAGVRRSYSLANAPRPDNLIELVVKRYDGGVLSNFWFDRARPGDLVRIEGPFGTFFLRDNLPANLIFLATGTGIAPVKALLEELAAQPARAAQHAIRVYWGNRAAESFWWNPANLALTVDYQPLLSATDAAWRGERGYVQDVAVRDGFPAADTVVYACGSAEMIAAARNTLTASGLSPLRFFSDAFVSSS